MEKVYTVRLCFSLKSRYKYTFILIYSKIMNGWVNQKTNEMVIYRGKRRRGLFFADLTLELCK